MRSEAEVRGILGEVRRRLDAHRAAGDMALCIPEGGYVVDNEWVTIIVEPAFEGARAARYVEALSRVKDELRADGYRDVLLVPAIA